MTKRAITIPPMSQPTWILDMKEGCDQCGQIGYLCVAATPGSPLAWILSQSDEGKGPNRSSLEGAPLKTATKRRGNHHLAHLAHSHTM